jgi:hypothetical protein
MPFNASGITTGLLGYTLRKEFLGEGMFYRETEVYNYEIYSKSANILNTPFKEIEGYIKAQFAIHSGNINVKQLSSPAEYQFPNDHVRVGKYNVEVEIRRVPTGLNTFQTELDSNRYKGLNNAFFTGYANYLNSFGEDFTFETNENGVNVYSHNISFTLQSGNKDMAVAIGSGIFANDKDTTFGINAYVGGVTVADTTNYFNYYNETYDLVRGAYSFVKRREVLPVGAATYNHNLSHSLSYKPNGVIDVNERGSVQGRLTFAQAKAGYDTLYAGAYTRCNTVFTDFRAFAAGATVADSLVNFPLVSNKVFNKADNSVEYEVAFTNDVNLSSNGRLTDRLLTVELTEDKYVNIMLDYGINYLNPPIRDDQDDTHSTHLSTLDAGADTEVSSFYTASSFYNSTRPSVNRVKTTFNVPKRRNSYNASFSYTNNPIYFVQLDGVTYAILDFKISDLKPADIINEYRVINRPSKMSVINYAYQTERGTKNVTITAKLQRGASNVFSSPRSNLSTNLNSIYRYAISKLMNGFNGTSVLSLNYYLSDVRYRVNSDDEITLDLAVTYAVKKYYA